MYADDAVIYIHAKTRQYVLHTLTAAMSSISDWLMQACLTLNISKTPFMDFLISKMEVRHPDIFAKGKNLQIVSDIKHLGIPIDLHLTFEKQVEDVISTAKLNLRHFLFLGIDYQQMLPSCT